MPGITPINSRDSLPKGMQYPLRYADIEAALEPFAEYDVFVEAYFNRSAHLATSTEQTIKEDEYRIATVGYYPTIRRSGPWDDADAPVLVDVGVSAIPIWLAQAVNLRRPALRKLLSYHVRRLMAESIHETRFWLCMTLRLNPARIKIDIQTGVADEPGSHETSKENLLEDLNRSIGTGE